MKNFNTTYEEDNLIAFDSSEDAAKWLAEYVKNNDRNNFVDDIISNEESNVNHPQHYNSGKFEVIDVIDDWKLGFCLGNAIKYIARAGKKAGNSVKQDLEKAIWYIQHYIDSHC